MYKNPCYTKKIQFKNKSRKKPSIFMCCKIKFIKPTTSTTWGWDELWMEHFGTFALLVTSNKDNFPKLYILTFSKNVFTNFMYLSIEICFY